MPVGEERLRPKDTLWQQRSFLVQCDIIILGEMRILMKLKPLHGWAVIQTSKGTEMNVGGVLVLDPANGTPQEGVVEAIGLGAYEVEKRGKEKEERS